MKYTLAEIAAITGGRLEGADMQANAVFTDSRNSAVGGGAVFVAIAGRNHDGHAYIGELYKRGVRAFVVERAVAVGDFPQAGFVTVGSSVAALQAVAADWRSRFRGTVVGVTGSNGKTVVKEWIAALAPASVKLFRSPKSYNSQIGVPLSVLMMRGDEDVAVIEAGISQPGEMAALERIVRPDIGVVTTLGDAHQERFVSQEQKTREKLLLFGESRTIIYNSAYPVVEAALKEIYPDRRLVDAAEYVAECAADATPSQAGDGVNGCVADAIPATADGDVGSYGGAGAVTKNGGDANVCGGADVPSRSGEPGESGELRGNDEPDGGVAEAFGDEASRQNAAAALAVCDVLGFGRAETVARLGLLQPVAMRLELKEGINDSLIVNDTYNSDINSLSIALDYLDGVAGGRRRMLVLSDILQSGFAENELYRRVAALVEAARVDNLVGIGESIGRYRALFPAGSAFWPTAEAFLGAVRRDDIAGRAILLKGNRGSAFERISHALERRSHTTTLEIDLDAMVHNLNAHRARLRPDTRMMAMVKASGYGNGAYEIAGMLQRQGVDYLAVAFADEGVQLRERGIAMPIVVLNADSDSFELMVSNALEPEIYNFASLEGFAAVLRRYGERDYPVHIKLDTGMHRLGFGEADAEKLAGELTRYGGLIRVNTVFSHLAASDDPAEDAFTHGQIAAFERMSRQIMAALPYTPLRHIANSAAIERLPDAEFDMVRLGIGLYGVGGTGLRPVSTLRTRIVQVRDLAPGETVGYAREGVIAAQTRVAVIPVGYADGLNRHLGNGRWSVLVGGHPAPTLGRISMDTCVIDITGMEAAEGDDVVIFSPAAGNTVEDMARVLGTIPYEVMTSVSERVKRIYIKE
ncbi:alanine racemase [Alistipes sp. OttesenSCG-928-B03]|nr:alanine racemase [Alistipes sp. OttesenSCG-928-B03]